MLIMVKYVNRDTLYIMQKLTNDFLINISHAKITLVDLGMRVYY